MLRFRPKRNKAKERDGRKKKFSRAGAKKSNRKIVLRGSKKSRYMWEIVGCGEEGENKKTLSRSDT